MSPEAGLDTAQVNAAPTAAAEKAAAAKLELLDGDEIVQFSIKPSLWYIPVVSFNWVVGAGVVAAVLAAAQPAAWPSAISVVFLMLVLVAVVRVAVAALQWASRLYVLTNRRVMRFHGVLRVETAACPLKRITQVRPVMTWYQRVLQLGSIELTPVIENSIPIVWEHVAHPQEVYEKLLRAIRKSQSGPGA
jgi:hypothetical protein